MTHSATLIYSESLVRQAVFSFWWRGVGVGYFLAIAVASLWVTFSVAAGDRSWVIGVMGTVTVMGVVIAPVVLIVHYRNSMQKFREMVAASATIVAAEATFTLASDLGSSTFKWAVVKEIWKFQDFWLLIFSRSQFATLPLESIPVEMQNFILQRVTAYGGKIV